MKRLLICDASTLWSGGAQRALGVAEGVRAAGIECRILCLKKSVLFKRARESGFFVTGVTRLFDYSPLLVINLHRTLCQFHPDVVDIHSPAFYWTMSVLARWSRKKSRVIITRNVGFDIANAWINRFLYNRLTDAVIVLSKATAEVLKTQAGVPPNKIHLVYQGFKPALFETPGKTSLFEKLKIPAGVPVIVIMARLDAGKGHRFVLKSFGQVAQQTGACLICLGDGNEKAALQKMTAALGLQDHVFFPGFCDDARAILARADISLLPSLAEGLSNVILETFALGKVMIATDVGGNGEAIRHNENGLLIPPRDAGAIADALCRVLSDAALRKRLSENGRRTFLAHFTDARMIADTLAVYEHGSVRGR